MKNLNLAKKEQREECIVEYLPLVRYLAQKIHSRIPSTIELDDLVSAGIVGLIDAFERFDPKRNTSFRTYAEFRIRGAILDELRARDWFPRSVRDKVHLLKDAKQRLRLKLGREPNVDELSNYLEMDIERVNFMLAHFENPSFVNLEGFTDQDELSISMMEDSFKKAETDPFERVQAKELKSILLEEIEKFGYREKAVLGLYYVEELNLKEIGEILGVTESRVSQIHTSAIAKLRQRVQRRISKEERENSGVKKKCARRGR